MNSRLVVLLVLGLVGSLSGMDGSLRRVSIRVPSQRGSFHIYQNVHRDDSASYVATLQKDLIRAIQEKEKSSVLSYAVQLIEGDREGLNFTDPQTGNSPLIMAILSDDREYANLMTRILVANGASVQEPTFRGENPLEYAMESDLNQEIVSRMVAIMHPNAK